MKSIRSRFIILTLVVVLFSSIVLGGISLIIFTRAQEASSNRIMNLTCGDEGNALNAQMSAVRSAVEAVASTAMNDISSRFDLLDTETMDIYVQKLANLADTVSQNVHGVVGYYVYFRASADQKTFGFYYNWSEKHNCFTQMPTPTYYDKDGNRLAADEWFKTTIKRGEPCWLEPCFNGIMNTYLVPYVYPLYKNGVIIGVVGMDVNFSAIAKTVQSIKPFDTGEAFLVSDEGQIYYHPTFRKDTMLADVIPDLAKLTTILPQGTSLADDECITYRYEGNTRKLVYTTLENGMNLVLTADVREINATRDGLSRAIIANTVLIALISLVAVLSASSRITKPLAKITAAADQIAQGNLDVELPPPGQDEVGILANSFAVTTRYLREYVTNMNNLAYQDPLTGVKNKAAFSMAQERLQKEIEKGTADFGFLVADMNDLKKINDAYGHERGDVYLRTGCRAICQVFHHSPVFRIGGDEFVVLLERDDKRNCQELLEELDRRIAEAAGSENPWERPSIAIGTAFYGKGDRKVDDVFVRADMAMYDDKRRIKSGEQ